MNSLEKTIMLALSAACRSCGQTDLQWILSLGPTPLANAVLTTDQLGQPEETYPLDFVFCPACTLVQIIETVAPEKLFSQYFSFSSFSDTVRENAQVIAADLIARRSLGKDSLMVEIASKEKTA
jgi:hypothetical protein